MHHNSSQQTTAALAEPDESAEKTKMSRVSFLVERMHSGLSKTRKAEAFSSSEPAKSSPTAPQVQSLVYEDSSSQLSNHVVEDVVVGLSQAAMNDETPVPVKHTVQKNKNIGEREDVGASSDFGDDDIFDYEMLDAFDTDSDKTLTNGGVISTEGGTSQPTNHERNKTTRRPSVDLSHDLTSKVNRISTPHMKVLDENAVVGVLSINDNQQPDDDEFDEDDGEVFAADLEDVFAKYDTQPPRSESVSYEKCNLRKPPEEESPKSTARTPVCTSKVKLEHVVDVLSSEDEDFGDDADFEQMCAEATQEVEHGAPSHSMVYDDGQHSCV